MSSEHGVPATAAWRHCEARDGFESVFISSDATGYRFEGSTAAVEDGIAWWVTYSISLDTMWRTRTARIAGRSEWGPRAVVLEADGRGAWWIDGQPAPQLSGCLDVDLEASACTNTFPVHRMRLDVGATADAPAAYVRALDLRVERLEQRYARVADDGRSSRYDYEAPAFAFEACLVYDETALVVDYPGIARRVL
jgi:hypothetical protein